MWKRLREFFSNLLYVGAVMALMMAFYCVGQRAHSEELKPGDVLTASQVNQILYRLSELERKMSGAGGKGGVQQQITVLHSRLGKLESEDEQIIMRLTDACDVEARRLQQTRDTLADVLIRVRKLERTKAEAPTLQLPPFSYDTSLVLPFDSAIYRQLNSNIVDYDIITPDELGPNG